MSDAKKHKQENTQIVIFPSVITPNTQIVIFPSVILQLPHKVPINRANQERRKREIETRDIPGFMQ